MNCRVLVCFLLGFVYGAKKGKILNMFMDDLSLPQPDEFGTQEVNEVCIDRFPFEEGRAETTITKAKSLT